MNRLGKILNINFVDHLIISQITYASFKSLGLMDKLEQSLRYVPTYQAIERIRKEEKAIAKEKIQSAKNAKARLERQQEVLIAALLDKEVSIENIAKILEVTPKAVEKLIKKK